MLGDLIGKLAGNVEAKESDSKPAENEHSVITKMDSLIQRAENVITRHPQETTNAAANSDNSALRCELKQLKDSLANLTAGLNQR